MTMSSKPVLHAVVRSADCVAGPPGEPGFTHARVGRADVLVARRADGTVVAFAAECPHQATPLDGATFFEGKLRCGRHLYLYDLETGENVLPARESSPEALRRLKPGFLPIHRVEEHDGWVWVAERPEPPPPCFDPAAEAAPGAGAARPPGPSVAVPAPATASAGAGGPVEHPPEALAVRVGEEFELVLATAPRPAHLWRSAVSTGIVAILSEGFAPDQPPRHIARVVARTPGETEIRFTYATPWDPKPVEIRSFVVQVE